MLSPREPHLLAFFTVCLVVPFSCLQTSTLPDDATISNWGNELEQKLTELVLTVTSVETARKSYKPDKGVTLEKVSGEEILENVLKNMKELLERKRRCLRRLVDAAEKNVVYLDATYGSMLSLEEVSFLNMKAPPPLSFMPYDDRFRQRISYETSGVHIPLEIFDGYPQMLNGLNWTQSLDDVFKENMQEDPAISWQYFGSTYGFMRVYPAFRWPDHPSLPDLFDVRRRSWYVQGSVSPKDVIILIDRSGSVHGQTLDIMKITVRALLNSLGENDYVNVAWFNNQVRWVVPCVNTLVQATAQNRRLLSDAVERLSESNLTSYTAALDFAFEAFRKFDEERRPWSGANCHKAIMFLSDGGTDWPEELVTQHCNQSRTGHIKMFTFACGPHPIPTVVLKEMACATGGYFSPITALGSVRVKIQDYARVLSRPLAYAATPDLFQWHNFYRDIGGLGMMTTITLPVYSKLTNETSDRLLGVMGIDIPVNEMTALYPKHVLGPFGYPFSVNTNGFVVFHPRLKDHIVYIEDPPDVDLTDLEGLSFETEQMRRNMVDGKQGHLLEYMSLVPIGQGHAIPVKFNYFYGAVDESTFRFGVAVPSDAVHARFALKDLGIVANALESLDGLLLAPWNFCRTEVHEHHLTPSQIIDRIRSNASTCDPTLVQHLLWDATHAVKIQEEWKRNPSEGVYSRFLMTSGGLSLIQPADAIEVARRKIDPFGNTLYKWASRTGGCVLSVSRGRSYDLTAACRILYKDSFVSGVIGVEMERSLVANIFHDVTESENLQRNCGEPGIVHCYLLNDGGIIIATNQPDVRAGEFVGLHDPQIVRYLRESGVMTSEYRFNYHSWCSKESYQVQVTVAASGAGLPDLLWNFISSLKFAVFESLFLLFSSLALWSTAESKDSSDASNHSCVTRSSWYHVGNDAFQCDPHNSSCLENARLLKAGTFWCPNSDGACERAIRAQLLPNLTSILIIAEPPCLCFPHIQFESIDPQDVGPDHCEIKQPYRRRPEECFVEMPETNETDCGAGSGSATTFQLFLLDNLVLSCVYAILVN